MADDRLLIYPNVAGKDYVSVEIKPSGIRLQAKGYVGVIPINDRLVLDVRPRVPVANLARLMDVSGETPAVLANAMRHYEVSHELYPSLLVAYAAGLRANLEEIAAAGFLREYGRVEELTSFPRGRLSTNRTLQQKARGIGHRAAVVRFARTVDNPSNRCLLFAVSRLFAYVAQLTESLDRSQRNRAMSDLNIAHHLLTGVQLDHTGSFLRDGVVMGRSALPSNRNYYREPLDLALAIIGREAVLIDRTGSYLRVPSMLIKMSDVFEGYLRELLGRGRQDPDWGWTVLDGNVEPPTGGRGNVFDGETLALADRPEEYVATPDVVLQDQSGHQRPVIVEVKYKPAKVRPDRSDLNQAIAYAASYGASHAVLAQPKWPGGSVSSGLKRLGSIGKVTYWRYVFDLGTSDLPQEEKAWVKAIRGLVS